MLGGIAALSVVAVYLAHTEQASLSLSWPPLGASPRDNPSPTKHTEPKSAGPRAASASVASNATTLTPKLDTTIPEDPATLDPTTLGLSADTFILRCDTRDPACGHQCKHFSDCPEKHACLVDPITHLFRCFKSECESDKDCGPTSKCSVVSSSIQPDVVRMCVEHGAVADGGYCSSDLTGQHCSAGFICHYMTCMRQCENDGDCKGTKCTQVPGGKVCVPDCSVSGCPEGQTCMSFDGNMSLCLAEVGANCIEHNDVCAKDEVCTAKNDPRSKQMIFKCRRRCNSATGSGCREGEVCGASFKDSVCYKACSQIGDCDPSEMCRSVTEDLAVLGCD